MKLNVILPSYPLHPSGGHKIMYQYANLFATHGWDVQIYHVMDVPYVTYKTPKWFRIVRGKCFYNGTPSWLPFDPHIKFACIAEVRDKEIRDADIAFSTMWPVAIEVNKLSPSKGRKINLIQGYETFIGNDTEGLFRSYKLPITHVVIADYLRDIVKKHSGIEPEMVYNAVDPSVFSIQKDISERNPHSVSMMYSTADYRGLKYGLEALRICKKTIPDLECELFGVYANPHLPEPWIHYHYRPKDLCALYNRTAIFATPSLKEGWGLPATEAMTCGCALVCTNIEGYLMYAKAGETALLAEPGNAQDLADKLLSLLQNDTLRKDLAKRGNAYVQRFSWTVAYEKMNAIFQTALRDGKE